MDGLVAPFALVDAWERGAGGHAHERASLLLSAAFPDARDDALGDLSIGARDATLLDVRSNLFGRVIDGTTTCGVCGETLELVFDVDQVMPDRPEETTESLQIVEDGYSVAFRLPNNRDLGAIAEAPDADRAVEVLLELCVLDAVHDGERVFDLPARVIDAIEAAMAAADPQGDLEIETICPACASSQIVVFDVVSFVWAEIETHARHLLQEVHELACAYGWPESEIFALSPTRRAYYLELATE